MSAITTHILDTASGMPAAGVRVKLLKDAVELASGVTDDDGRCRTLLPEGQPLAPGVYNLLFEIGPYFPHGFYPEVNVCFSVRGAAAHYHVPLLISPFGYTTYRGS